MSTHTSLRTLVRAELRSLLHEILAALPPPDGASPPALPLPPPPAMGRVFDAWAALDVAGRGMSAADAVRAGAAQPAAWEALLDAVGEAHSAAGAARARERAAAGETGGAAHALGQALRKLRGRAHGGRVMVGAEERAAHVMIWRVAPVSPSPLAPPPPATP